MLQPVSCGTADRETECSLPGSITCSVVLPVPTRGLTEGTEQQQSELQCSTVPITAIPRRTVLVARETGTLQWQTPTVPAGVHDNQGRCISPGLGSRTYAMAPGQEVLGVMQAEQQLHMNCLELLGATLAVKAFVKDQRGCWYCYTWTIRQQ